MSISVLQKRMARVFLTRKSWLRRCFWVLPLLALTLVPYDTRHEARPTQSHPCLEDDRRLCPDAQAGQGQLLRCLEEHESELSGVCRERIKVFKEGARRNTVAAGRNPATTSDSRVPSEPFAVSYQAGKLDAGSNLMGGTELMNLVAYKGKLYAGVGYWEDESSNDQTPGAQILVLDSPRDRWRIEHTFSERLPNGSRRFRRVTALQVITFATDGRGRALPQLVSMLVAGLDPFGGGAVFSLDDDTGRWSETELPRTSYRALTLYRDPITGVDRIFAGGAGYEDKSGHRPGGIFSGVYDPSAPGRIRWSETAEFTGFGDRVVAFADCNGHLYFSSKPGIYERTTNGSHPVWSEIYSYSHPMRPNSSGLRGLTTIPNPNGSGQVILAAAEEAPCVILRIDPADDHRVTTELNVDEFLFKHWGRLLVPYVIAAYNSMPIVRDPDSNQSVHIIGLQAFCPLPGKEHSAWYLIRDANARYSLHEIRPVPLIPESGQPSHHYLSMVTNGRPTTERSPNLGAVRTIIVSPFASDTGHALYFGGYDTDGRPAHNTAWLYRVGLRTALFNE